MIDRNLINFMEQDLKKDCKDNKINGINKLKSTINRKLSACIIRRY